MSYAPWNCNCGGLSGNAPVHMVGDRICQTPNWTCSSRPTRFGNDACGYVNAEGSSIECVGEDVVEVCGKCRAARPGSAKASPTPPSDRDLKPENVPEPGQLAMAWAVT